MNERRLDKKIEMKNLLSILEQVTNLIDRMLWLVRAVIEAKGGQTRYRGSYTSFYTGRKIYSFKSNYLNCYRPANNFFDQWLFKKEFWLHGFQGKRQIHAKC